MIRFLLLLSALAMPAAAETARVLSGEHGDFTRLVIELPADVGWDVGRTSGGYAFMAKTPNQPDFDLSAVWQRISRSRLQDMTVDPATGALGLTLACDCHIFPFEYRPGVIVLDIKPGQAPPASAFEVPFPPTGLASVAASGASSAESAPDRSYDWLKRNRTGIEISAPAPAMALPLDTGAVSLDPLRDELLEQIARGAVDGVVDMELPGKPRSVPVVDSGDLPWSEIRIGEQPGVVVLDPDAFEEGATPLAECPATELLDVPSWGSDRLANDLLAETRSGLYGEFDTADPEAVLRSVRTLLFLGFGAEAGQNADLLDVPTAYPELALYQSMAILIDGGADPQTPFARMLDCDGPAALWAALAHDRLPRQGRLNRDAVLQSFLALPSHLRQHLGPSLAEKFIAQSDAEAARLIRDAIERTPDADTVAVELLDAKADLAAGDAKAAQSHAKAALALDGDSTESLIALVEAHFQKLEPLEPGIAEALLALRRETDGTAISAKVDRSLLLALALSGQTNAAFVDAAATGPVLADLWKVALDRATDDDFLHHAMLQSPDMRPKTSPEVAQGVASRLLKLGFPDAALGWLGPVSGTDQPDRRIIAANAELARGNATVALTHLKALTAPEAETLRAAALIRLEDLPAASAALVAAGDTVKATRLGIWQGDWKSLDPGVPEAWLSTASHVRTTPSDQAEGLLARGSATLDQSLAARGAVEALLSLVPSPSED